MEFINYINKDFERQFEVDVKQDYAEVRNILPTLPENIQIYFMAGGLVHGMNTGGFAYSPDIISLSLDSSATDNEGLRHDLRSTMFHEAFHLTHGYTGQTGPFTLLESAIQEGSATLFEIKYADSKSKDLFGNYSQHSSSQLNEWLELIKRVKNTNEMSRNEYESIAYYDAADDTRWKLYKTGTWLVDEYIKKANIDIKDFTNEDIESIINSLSVTI